MICAGLDVGSRTIALVILDGDAVDSTVVDTGVNPLRRCQKLLNGKIYEHLVVTGYGRHQVANSLEVRVVSEIRAHAIGARYFYQDCHTLVDIGGQDSKVIMLSDQGAVRKFEMNDRCSAGTGKFLEVMAGTLETTIEAFGNLALGTKKVIRINSLCTVFAESEVISIVSQGEEVSAIALALHEAVATRIAGMIRRVGVRERVVFTGGAALNNCLKKLIGEKIGVRLTVPDNPQIVGALGAALIAKMGYKP